MLYNEIRKLMPQRRRLVGGRPLGVRDGMGIQSTSPLHPALKHVVQGAGRGSIPPHLKPVLRGAGQGRPPLHNRRMVPPMAPWLLGWRR